MDKRRIRQKASDVFRETNYLFPKTDKFDEAFPIIEEINVEVIESGEGINKNNEKQYFNKYILSKFIDCHNPMCYNGGVDVGSMIRGMEYTKETKKECLEMCQGYEGSPKGKKKNDACLNMFKVKISIKYKKNFDN